MRVLGVDPGTWRTGYGLLLAASGVSAEDWGTITFKTGTSLDQRLHQLYSSLLDLIRRHRPDELAVEDPFIGRGRHRFAASAFALGQAQAAVAIATVSEGVPVYRYSPAQVKLAVADYGRATKAQVQALVAHQLGLEPPFPPTDAADALGIALCHLARRNADNVLTQQVEWR